MQRQRATYPFVKMACRMPHAANEGDSCPLEGVPYSTVLAILPYRTAITYKQQRALPTDSPHLPYCTKMRSTARQAANTNEVDIFSILCHATGSCVTFEKMWQVRIFDCKFILFALFFLLVGLHIAFASLS